MPHQNKLHAGLAILIGCIVLFFTLMPFAASEEKNSCLMTQQAPHSLSAESIARQLGWVQTKDNRCGGYYLEEPILYPSDLVQREAVVIKSNQGLFSLHGTSSSEGSVVITRLGQQIVANKAYLYRDPTTQKISAVEMIDQVQLREPNDLIIAECGRYTLKNHAKSLHHIIYRTAIYGDTVSKPAPLSHEALQQEHKVTQLTAWGQANAFKQEEPSRLELDQATYTTCPPLTSVWTLKTSHLTLDKNSGRGVARHGRVLVKGIPILYSPYFNFPIDSRRATGFLSPTMGTSSKSGLRLSAPFYWNLAPNYDSTITPSYLSIRGLQITDTTRYLTQTSTGAFNIGLLPNDKAFADFQVAEPPKILPTTNPFLLADLNRLTQASTTRKAFSWQHNATYNEHWSSYIDYNYVSDDYYLKDLSSNLNEVTQNQLLQQAELNYKGQNWHFVTRVQGYQTLHPVTDSQAMNQPGRFPQLILEGDYPNERTGLDYFINNDLTHFDFRNTPGDSTKFPMGNRLNVQPGISWPLSWPYLNLTPRLQMILTKYDVGHVPNNSPKLPGRGLPVFDMNAALYLDRSMNFFHHALRQTLEPQAYYTYIPYRDQNELPVFDTTLNQLTYDQIFMYNRFSGLDRIGDANQVGIGITTRFIEQQSGLEKIRASIGQILYFQHRRVTLCNPSSGIDAPCPTSATPENRYPRSPVSGLLTYALAPNWNASANTIWNTKINHLDNQTVALSYHADTRHLLNVSYTYFRQGDPLPFDVPDSSSSNLSQTDFSASWPLTRDWSHVARWTQNWNHRHLQNLLYGLQYDSCCWAVRFVAGRTYNALTPNTNTFQYNTQFFIQFALKGLGTVGSGDPSQYLNSSITGYDTHFGRDF